MRARSADELDQNAYRMLTDCLQTALNFSLRVPTLSNMCEDSTLSNVDSLESECENEDEEQSQCDTKSDGDSEDGSEGESENE